MDMPIVCRVHCKHSTHGLRIRAFVQALYYRLRAIAADLTGRGCTWTTAPSVEVWLCFCGLVEVETTTAACLWLHTGLPHVLMVLMVRQCMTTTSAARVGPPRPL